MSVTTLERVDKGSWKWTLLFAGVMYQPLIQAAVDTVKFDNLHI